MLLRKRSVASITKTFDKTVKQLAAHADKSDRKAAAIEGRIFDLHVTRRRHADEAILARTVGERIAALVA